jgi:hypothetical protein
MSSAEAISASARQVVDDLCRESQLRDGSVSALFGSAVGAAPTEEAAEVKYEDLPRPEEVLMVAESSTSDSDSTSSDSSEEVEGVTASLANFNKPLVPSPPMPSEAAEIMYIHKRFGTQHRRHKFFATRLVAVVLYIRALSRSAKMMASSDHFVAVALTTRADKT